MVEFLEGLGLSPQLLIFVISMVPFVELRGGIIAVSYTHLDVYKRQVYDGAEFEYNGCFIKYWGLQDMGIFKILEDCDDFTKFNEFGRSLA